jgi:hypothetical protein
MDTWRVWKYSAIEFDDLPIETIIYTDLPASHVSLPPAMKHC